MRLLDSFFDWLNDLLVVRPARKRMEAEEALFQQNLKNLWQRPKGENDGEQN